MTDVVDFLEDKTFKFTDFLIDKFSDVVSFGSEVISGSPSLILSTIGDLITIVLRWFYSLIFVDLFSDCEVYGYKILDFLFSSFAVQPFQFSAIEFVVGFIFLIFIVKITIQIVGG